MSRNQTARHLRNVKHVGSISGIHHEIDDYLKHLGQITNHHAPSATLRFNPSRTSNPDVALQWEARVQELHARTRVFRKKSRKFNPQEKAKLLEMAYYYNKYGVPF